MSRSCAISFFFSGGEVEGARCSRGSAVLESFRDVGVNDACEEEKGQNAETYVARSRMCNAWPCPRTSIVLVGWKGLVDGYGVGVVDGPCVFPRSAVPERHRRWAAQMTVTVEVTAIT